MLDIEIKKDNFIIKGACGTKWQTCMEHQSFIENRRMNGVRTGKLEQTVVLLKVPVFCIE